MKSRPNNDFYSWPAIVVLGISSFIILYYTATLFYPGGSNFDHDYQGFNWSQNYWCELLGKNAKNGQENLARPFGMIAMIVMSLSISLFWIKFSSKLIINSFQKKAMKFCGIVSMICSSLVFTDYHDLFIFLAVLFGIVPFVLSIYAHYKAHFYLSFFFSSFCVILIIINNLIYILNFQINALPVIQKITFGSVFIWFTAMSLHSYRPNKRK